MGGRGDKSNCTDEVGPWLGCICRKATVQFGCLADWNKVMHDGIWMFRSHGQSISSSVVFPCILSFHRVFLINRLISCKTKCINNNIHTDDVVKQIVIVPLRINSNSNKTKRTLLGHTP